MALISVTISGNAAPLKKSLDDAENKFGKFGGAFTKLGVAAAAQASGDVSQGVGTGGRVAFPDGAASCGGRRRSRWLPARGWWWSRGRDRGYGSGPTRVHG